MKLFVIVVWAFVFTFMLYALAYIGHFYHNAWWVGATWVMGSIVMIAAPLGIMYALMEMK